MIGFKAFRIKNNKLCFLFHGYNGSLEVPIGRWLTTKQRRVRDGRGRYYRSGFHFMHDMDAALNFNQLTKGKYEWRAIEAKNIRPKPGSRTGIWLAQKIRVRRGA